RRRHPDTSLTPAAGSLLERPNHGPRGGPFAGESLCLVIGAADRVAANQPITPRQTRLGLDHRTKRAEAAASAAPTIGPGSTKKNSVTIAVTNSTPFSSVVIGRSKIPAGSSKYMTLTTRR